MKSTACVMRFALVDGKRREPEKGLHGFCELCGCPAVSHCGEIEKPHHWQHAPGVRNCDSWWEPETPWHRGWKDKFPKEWQEIIIGNKATREKHRADIKTDDGLVIEFQNSPIFPSTIRDRETFYGNMIWVINATFHKKFILADEVTRRLKLQKEALPEKETIIKNTIDTEIKEQASKVNKIERQLKDDTEDAAKLQRKISEYQKDITDYKRLSDEAIKWIINGEGYYLDLYDSLQHNYKERLLNIRNIVSQNLSALNNAERELRKITSLEDEEINERKFKKIPYDNLNKSNYSKAYVIVKSSKGTLFRDYQKIPDEMELFRYKYRADAHNFFMDYSEDISSLQKEIEKHAASKQDNEQEREQIESEIAERVKAWLLYKISSAQEKLYTLNIQIPNLKEECDAEKKILNVLQNSKTERYNSDIEDLKRANENNKQFIKNRYQGSYRLIKWNREHKAWQDASRPIFFDVGEHLLEKDERGLLREISVEDFVKRYTSH